MRKWIVLLLLVGIVVVVGILDASIPKQGYYLCTAANASESIVYYNQNGQWFVYTDDTEQWMPIASIDEAFKSSWKRYYQGLYYTDTLPATDFAETAFYAEHVRNHVYLNEE